MTSAFRFQFDQSVPLEEAEMTLQLSLLVVGSLLGDARVRIEGGYRVDAPNRAIEVDDSAPVGRTAVRVFTGLLFHEFGEDSFQVRHLPPPAPRLATGHNALSEASVSRGDFKLVTHREGGSVGLVILLAIYFVAGLLIGGWLW